MALTVTCPECDKTLKLKDEMAGKKVRCPGCSSIISVPKPSIDSDDDFLGDLDEPAPQKRKKRKPDDDYEEYDDEPPVKSTRSRKPEKKKQRRGKSSGTNWVLVGGLVGGGLIALVLVASLIAAIGQARRAVANRDQGVWPTFRHPLGFAQVDMPGTPTLNAAQSMNGSQTFTLAQRNYQLSLTAAPLQGPVKIAIATNPAMADLMFNEMKTKLPQQLPGSNLISSRELVGGIKGLEMKINFKGNINVMRFFLFSDALIGCEFITQNEAAYGADRERFFNSLRGPDGNPVNGQLQPPGGAPAGNAHSPSGPATPKRSLTEARAALKTKLVRNEKSGQHVPNPPASMARLVQYDSPVGKLKAYVTTIPSDGQKHPAIVWISGGDCNSIDDGFFMDSPPNNDQTASAFRKAGIVTMYPSLRGGNDNPGFKESFLGEVDDVIAAADFLSKQDGIDPQRIYLGGHSTGGTVVLLVAESTNRFRAIFSFGPVEDIRGYGAEFIPFDGNNTAELEARTPALWLEYIQNRTFVIEGQQQGNIDSLQSLARSSKNPQAKFLSVPRANHFNILAPVTKVIADKILQDQGPTTTMMLTEAELNLNYAP